MCCPLRLWAFNHRDSRLSVCRRTGVGPKEMAHFQSVPVVEVHNENLRDLWPTELSGLGDRKRLNAKSVDVRFEEICDVAKTRSVISLGLSCFKFIPKEEKKAFHFQESEKEVQTARRLFSELVLSEVPVVLHNALVDLVFLYQNFYAELPASMQKFTADLSEIFPGGVFDTKYISEFKSRMPASYLEYIFRKSQRDNRDNAVNGKKYVELGFLSYPDSMKDVILLPCGLDDYPHQSQDGKTTACFHFGSYGWCPKGNRCENSHDIDCILDTEGKRKKKKNKRQHKQISSGNVSAHVDTPQTMDTPLTTMETSFDSSTVSVLGVMETEGLANESSSENSKYAKLEMSIDEDQVENNGPISAGEKDSEVVLSKSGSINDPKTFPAPLVRRTGGHRAGYDSFMTGFAFACSVALFGDYPSSSDGTEIKLAQFGLLDLINKVALGGKDIPLLIQKSNFAKTSAPHNDKLQKIRALKKKS